MTAQRPLRQPCATAHRVEQNPVRRMGVDATVTDNFGTVIVAISCYIGPCTPGPEPRDCLIVAIEGEVDLDTAPPVQDALLRALDGGKAVCCDLSRVTFFGAAGARALFTACRYAAGRGRTFGVRGAHGITRRVLTLTDPDGLIDWHQ